MQSTTPAARVRFWHLIALVLCLAALPVLGAESLTIESVETCGISGLDWDATRPGAATIDAVHRSVLARFPGAAEKIASALEQGQSIEKVELLLDYAGYEIKPRRYIQRNYQKKWKNPPRWHVVAWPLRRPWRADPETGPTYNAWIRGSGYWTRFGAADGGEDRFAARMGPAEMSKEHPTCRLDITGLLTNAVFGRTLGWRLRKLEEQGVLLKKWELWDQRYDEYWSAYEWAKATGGHGLSFENPRLVVTLTDADTDREVELPAPTDFASVQRRLRSEVAGDATAQMPAPDELARLVERHRMSQPEWMPDWQWERVRQLRSFGGGQISRNADALESADPEQYRKTVQNILKKVPRYWMGWGIQDYLLLHYLYGDMFPEPVNEHMREYWRAWLMPGMPTDRFFHAQSKQNRSWWQKTGDWRGRKSFFRAGYNYTISTMNFNHTAAMGALLGGSIIGSQRAMADGRHGLEYLPMRLWAWYDGTTQESIDHYYYAITLSGQKMFADFGPRRLDRMMGRSILAKSVEELTSSYHPGLRRFINTSGRTGISYLWVIQDGLQHIVHTLSHSGALHDLENPDRAGMPRFGNDAPPGRIALQTLRRPWAPDWATNMVDEKPIPYQMTTANMEWGRFAQTPMWKKSYLGHHYGVASIDLGRQGSVPLMMQWRRDDQQVERLQQVGTLLARYSSNAPNLVTTKGGGGLLDAGNQVALQHENKILMLTSPLERLPRAKPEQTTSLQTTVGLFTFQEEPTWTLRVDGRPVEEFPVSLQAGQLITLQDGLSYVGLIPLPATDLGRTEELVITDQAEPGKLQGGGEAAPTLLVQSYNYLSDKPLSESGLSSEQIDNAWGGFMMEIGDQTEYDSFAKFQQHMESVQVESRWDAEEGVLHAGLTSGEDTLEMGFRPDYQVWRGKAVPTDQCFAYRRVNGEWPYLPDGIVRDSNLTVQGTTGRLEKNGAVLRSEYGRMSYLQTEPVTGTVCGWNPLPDATIWALELPGGAAVRSDGRVGMLRVAAHEEENRYVVDHVRKGEPPVGTARALLFFGLDEAPGVELNGQAYPRQLPEAEVGGDTAYVLPLDGRPPEEALDGIAGRYERSRGLLASQSAGDYRPRFVHDWHVVGPFESRGSTALWTRRANHYPPEEEIDLEATYQGFRRTEDGPKTQEVSWKRLLDEGEPALADGPVVLAEHFEPNQSVVGYAYTEITSDRERDLTLYTGSDVRLTVWINDDLVLRSMTFRAAAPDQDRAAIHLKKGVNKVLVKSANAWEGWSLYFRLGDEYGLPVTEGLRYGVEK
jgi:hypothetical protein